MNSLTTTPAPENIPVSQVTRSSGNPGPTLGATVHDQISHAGQGSTRPTVIASLPRAIIVQRDGKRLGFHAVLQARTVPVYFAHRVAS